MRQNAARLDLAALTLQFQQWATTYTVGQTNPLNQPNYLHFGMPESYGDLYKNTVGQSTDGCYGRMWAELSHKIEDNDKRKTACVSICDEMKCSLREQCDPYKRMTETPLEDTLSDEEKATVEQMRNWAQTARGGGLNG